MSVIKQIKQRIIGYQVKKDDGETEIIPALELEEIHEGLERPEVLIGSSYKIKPPNSDHAMYVTINDITLNAGTEHEQRRPYEIFINSKNMENFQWILALTRVVSAVFRKGGDSAFLAEELKAVFDPRGGYFKRGGVFCPSLVAEIGFVLDKHFQHIGLIKKEELSDHHKVILEQKRLEFEAIHGDEKDSSGFPDKATLCSKCNTKAVVLMDGCMTCLNCADSKCG